MNGDLICCNGKITRPTDTGLSIDVMLGSNFIYQKIHTYAHEPLHAQTHIEIAQLSYSVMYGAELKLSKSELALEIKNLLSANRYPQGSAVVVMYLFPDIDNGNAPIRIISCERQLLYKKYTIWHSALKAIITPYEYPFMPHKTAVSLAAHNYSQSYARQKRADVAINENYAGKMISVGEHPLFIVSEKTVYTASLEDGATDSVERRLGIKACLNAGWEVEQVAVDSMSQRRYEEFFFITAQGVVSIGSLNGRSYPNTSAKTIAAHLSMLSDAE